jgi:hypothetical protein
MAKMRQLPWLIACFLLAGCAFDKPVLENREEVAKCLPPMIYLDTEVTPQSGAGPFRVDDRLALLGVQVKEGGTLVDSRGKIIYTRPSSFPSNNPAFVFAETKRFLDAILFVEESGYTTFTSTMTLGKP